VAWDAVLTRFAESLETAGVEQATVIRVIGLVSKLRAVVVEVPL
jgi:hypothetical protein